MRPFRSGRLMMGIMLFCIAASLFGVIMTKDVYAGDKVTVKICAGWGENMSYTYMNEHVGDVCTEEARKKVCPNRNWSDCLVEGKGDEVVGELPGEETLSDNVITTPNGKDECSDNSGAVGWIICPIIEGVSNLGNWLWGEVETNFMQINAEELFQKHDGVLKAWSIFRDMANVIFVILFLVVIFSQLTGIGIDNYGIKKILPKLIVVAILINLSYLICILAVDLSNILGSGLNAMFSSIADQIPVDKYEISPGQSLVSWGLGTTGAAGGLVLFSLLSGPLGAFAIGAAVGLTVLGVVITIVISIVFLYLILVIRYAGVVLLIAIAPIAIVCYMLPNTEKLSKRWIDLLKSLLMVYPICGALVGAGKLAGNVLASTGNETLAIAGMIVSVLPFFLIPKLLKSSLALAGNIGAKLSSIGQTTGRGLSKTATGAITGSDRFKNWSQSASERFAADKARKVTSRLGNVLERGGNLSESQQRRLVQAQHTVAAYEGGREKMYKDIFARNDRGVNQAELARALRGTDGEKASAALSTLIDQGGISEALGELGKLSESDWNNMDAGMRNRLTQAMGISGVDAMKSYSKYRMSGGGASFSDWSTGSGATIANEASNVTIKDKTYAQHLMDGGERAMVNYTKDEMQYLNEHADNIRAGMTDNGEFGSMLKTAAINSNDATVQTLAENLVASQLASGGLNVDDMKITDEDIGNMRGRMAESIRDGVAGRYINNAKKGGVTLTMAAARNLATTDLRNTSVKGVSLGNQINGAKANPNVSSKAKTETKAVFGMP